VACNQEAEAMKRASSSVCVWRLRTCPLLSEAETPQHHDKNHQGGDVRRGLKKSVTQKVVLLKDVAICLPAS